MRRDRPFWKESDSTVMPEEPSALHGDDIRGRQRLIGAELRQWYDAIAQEPVPDEWLDLLNQTDRVGQTEKNGIERTA
jgi:hypothetical protein